MPRVERVLLEFDPKRVRSKDGKDLREGLSVAAKVGDYLYVASDETAALERLSWDGEAYRQHATFDLHEYFDLPTASENGEEIDVEGLSFDQEGNFLWVVGSHSLRRKKPKGDDDEGVEKLATVDRQANRYLLGRIPLKRGELVKERGKHRAAMLPVSKRGNALTQALADDEHLGPFLSIPSKENGFDIEGISVAGGRQFLGLRGPVLRGWSVVLSVRATARRGEPTEMRLRRQEEDGPRVRKHFLDLDGLGVREISHVGEDLLILAGPTMDLDGPVALYRWRGGVFDAEDALLHTNELEKVVDLHFGEGDDHAEGVAVLSEPGEPLEILVVHDAPCGDRLVGDHGLIADRVCV